MSAQNGNSESIPALEAAQQRLAKACMALPMNPAGAGISAYVNSTLLSAKVAALCELYVSPPNGSWSAQEALDAAIVRQMHARAEQMELAAEKARTEIQVANQLPPQLIRTN